MTAVSDAVFGQPGAMATMMPAMTLVMNGISLLIVWFGGKQIAQSNLQVGDMDGVYPVMPCTVIMSLFVHQH